MINRYALLKCINDHIHWHKLKCFVWVKIKIQKTYSCFLLCMSWLKATAKVKIISYWQTCPLLVKFILRERTFIENKPAKFFEILNQPLWILKSANWQHILSIKICDAIVKNNLAIAMAIGHFITSYVQKCWWKEKRGFRPCREPALCVTVLWQHLFPQQHFKFYILTQLNMNWEWNIVS